MAVWWPVAIGFVITLGLAWLGHSLGTHALSGVIAMSACYLFSSLGGGWVWGALVLLFFLSTIVWSHYGCDRKALLLDRLLGRSQIGWQQVTAQLGWGCVLAVLAFQSQPNIGLTGAFVGVIAAANADTWATEIGVLNRHQPRLMNNGRQAPAGTPGAVTLLGFVSAGGGAWLAGFTALVFYFIIAVFDERTWVGALLWLPISAMLGGLVGTVVDSFLGAAAQRMYYCEHCQCACEDAVHHCGLPARQTRGWPWLSSHGVDMVGSFVSAAVTMSCVLLAR
ncbi:MAG: DUF92 domain-containing protein [Anaerolineae bacterium]